LFLPLREVIQHRIQATEDEVSLDVGGMTCSSCSQAIESILKEEKGIINATVNLATETARVKFDPNVIGVRDIIRLIEDVRILALISPNHCNQITIFMVGHMY